MKKYFALLALLLAVFMVSCGDDDPVKTDDVLSLASTKDTVSATIAMSYAEASVEIENTSDEAVTISVTADLSGLASGHSLSLCIDGNCEEYKTQGFTSAHKITLEAGAKTTIDDFQAKINAMTASDGTPVEGEGEVVFTFAVDGTTETAEYTVSYKIENTGDVLLMPNTDDEVAATTTMGYSEAGVGIKNLSNETINLTVSADLSGLAAGHSLSLCLEGNCDEYQTADFTSENKITLEAGAETTLDDFAAKIYGMTTSGGSPVAGTGKVVFTFAVEGSDETAEYTVNYQIENPLLTLVEADTELQGSITELYELTSHATITHTSFLPLEIIVKMEFISREVGHSGTICTTLCYPPKTEDFTATDNMVLQPGQNSYEYGYSAYAYATNGDEYPDPTPGEDIIKYTFTVVGAPHQTVTYTCKYTFTD